MVGHEGFERWTNRLKGSSIYHTIQ